MLRQVAISAVACALLLACGETAGSGPISEDAGAHDAAKADAPMHTKTPDAAKADAPHTTECVEAVLGEACSPMTSAPCTQPANACEAGYIWSCSPATSVWYHELIACVSKPYGTTPMTSVCPAGEILFVDDAAGDPCSPLAGTGSGSGGGTGGCPAGSYLFEPGCCYSATNAWCVPTPAACSDGLSCGCLGSVCDAQCGVDGEDPGVMCASVADSVLDCFCGKA